MKTLKTILLFSGILLNIQTYAQTNVALGKSGTFTQNSTTTTLPVAVTDGNKTTIAMSFTASQNAPYFFIDLGANYDLTSIKFFWGSSYYAKGYNVNISPDNSTWINNLTVTNNTANTSSGDLRTFSNKAYGIRYLKINTFSSNAANYQIDLYEIEVYGTSTVCSNDGFFKKLFISDAATFNATATFGGAIKAASLTVDNSINSLSNMFLIAGGTNRISISGSNGLVSIFNDLVVSGSLNTTGTAKFGGIHVPFNSWILMAGDSWGADFPRLNFVHNGVHGYIDYMDNLHFRANKNWISALILQGDGNVGIGFGTTYNIGDRVTGGYKLAVNGSVKFQNGTTTNMIVTTDGNVGIGTTNNTVNGITYKLAVAGPVVATSIDIVGTVPAADYVFEQNYKLKSITELEIYINNNKHLPDIPSAKEFKEKGYSIGKLDDLLLKKVEELTLYVIEQNKRIEALEKENQLLKNK